MAATLFNNVDVWDGSADEVYRANVLVVGNRIKTVSATPIGEAAADAVLDGAGMTLMPGLVEGHAHPSFVGIEMAAELGRIPPEQHMLLTARNLRLLLDHGFTSIFEAASAKPLLGVTGRDAINSGLISGPRMKAASPEITTTAGLGDESRRYSTDVGFGLVADGADALRRVARECVRDGVDVIKVNISGDEFVSHARGEVTTIEEEELTAVVSIARKHGKTIAAHARSSESVKMAVRHGIDCIYHCDFANEEALDMLESVKDKCFVGPAVGLVHNCVHEGADAGFPPEVCEAMGLYRKFEACCATYHEMRKRGIRVVTGGDYGFSITPIGQNARDIEHFVRYFGYSPADALRCATVVGAQLMGMGDELGQVAEGFLADLLLVKGNPVADVTLLQECTNLALIMKDGVIHKDPRHATEAAPLVTAAE